ncbi:ATP-dependent Clp protease adapter ClpS [Piscirickettsia litoralis]|uniref:ATP-dependent Clp protease adapter protein ClpS n=1 Tax=Piscirickettsia litoralis TaxID=1891921 RepID=A0ABX3A5R9_9GAMM|nr:ATP-dependent Clp protease adapter ClpS [Piscirickettsia litoralis]
MSKRLTKLLGMALEKEDMEGDVATEVARPKLQVPPMYKVVLLNDDYTPMDFVVDILKRYFTMDEERATVTMLEIHTKGRATCGVYSRDVAETKVAQVNDYSKESGYPLLCIVEVDKS